MKKILPYIMMFIVFVNLFAPFAVDITTKNIINKNKVEAEEAKYWHFSVTENEKERLIKSQVNTKPGCLAERDSEKYAPIATRIPPNFELADCREVTDPILAQMDAAIAENNGVEGMPNCSPTSTFITGAGSFTGCIAQAIYYVLFVPVSWVFAFSGQFFDSVFAYSVNSASYDLEFVTQGWGVVRDFCNMFFIFVLLYVAISTILEVHGFKTKEMIINVIVIGVLINFSMLAAHLMIDASNILARVFYNNQTIKLTEGTSNIAITPGPSGEIPLSLALVNKFDPQTIVLEGKSHMNIERPSSDGSTNLDKDSNIGTGTFIIITLLSTAMSVVGIIVFISVGLIFVGRVVGLWFSIIFAPLAFFSYTVPKLQNMKMFGWRNWWQDTMSMCFLAPIFMFFLYLIISFLQKGLGLADASSLNGMKWWVVMIVPFVFIMMLLLKAKETAKDYSGSLGQSITSGVAAVGGLALGAGAAGIAFGGRNIIGRGLASASNSKAAEQFADPAQRQNMSMFMKPIGYIGSKINKNQKHIGEVDHARHEIDAIKDKTGLKNVSNSNLSKTDNEKIQKMFTKEKKSEIETDIRKGSAKLYDKNNNDLGNIGESGYKATIRDREENAYLADQGLPMSRKANLTDKDKKNIEDRLNQEFNSVLKISVDKESINRLEHLKKEAKEQVGGVTRAFTNANKASFDLRNASSIKSDKREGFFTKSSTAIIAGVALGVRQGLKNSGVDHGKGNGDFTKDIGEIIKTSLKSVKIEVPKGGGGGGHDDHGGGHDDHGGGHGGGH